MNVFFRIVLIICFLFLLFMSGFIVFVMLGIIKENIKEEKNYIIAVINSIGILGGSFCAIAIGYNLYFLLTDWQIVLQFLSSRIK